MKIVLKNEGAGRNPQKINSEVSRSESYVVPNGR